MGAEAFAFVLFPIFPRIFGTGGGFLSYFFNVVGLVALVLTSTLSRAASAVLHRIASSSYSKLASDDGLINAMVGHLYRSIEENEDAALFGVSVSYVQVYNEKIYDLLHPSSTDKALSIRENKKDGGVHLEGASDHHVASTQPTSAAMRV